MERQLSLDRIYKTYKICVLVGITQSIILCVTVSQNVNIAVAKMELRTSYEFSIILSP